MHTAQNARSKQNGNDPRHAGCPSLRLAGPIRQDSLDRINLVDEELAKGLSMTDLSTNTLGTSMWGDNGSFHTSRPGSAATLQSGHSSRPGSGQLRDKLKPPQPRPRITSWDSD